MLICVLACNSSSECNVIKEEAPLKNKYLNHQCAQDEKSKNAQSYSLRTFNKQEIDLLKEKPDDETSILLSCGLACLDALKAEDVVVFDIRSHSTVSDIIVVASGRSRRHVGVLAEKLIQTLKQKGITHLSVEGKNTCNWVLIDARSIIFHIFVPEVRAFYQLEKMWAQVSKKTYKPTNEPGPLDRTLSQQHSQHELLATLAF